MLAIQQENIILKQQVTKSNEDKTNIEQHLQHTIETLKQNNYQLQVKLYAQLVDAISGRYKAQADLFAKFADASNQRDALNIQLIQARYHYIDSQKITQWRIAKPIWRIIQKLYFLRQRAKTQHLCSELLRLNLIDPQAYLTAYPDISGSGLPPAEHYLRYGWLENRTIGINFDPIAYLQANPDVYEQNINPVTHYLENGLKEQRPVNL